MAGGNYDRSQKKSQLNPAVSYNFGLEVEAAFFVPVRSVRVFTKENEFDYYQEGGLNDYVHMLRKPISKPFTFQVERYVGVDSGMFDTNSGFIDPLALGTDLILPVILYVNRSYTKNAGDNFSFDNCARAYIFTGCTVTAKEYGELNAESSKLLTETTTIAYKELFAINQLNPAWERDGAWKFDDAKTNPTYLGKGEAHTSNRSKNKSKTDMIGIADKGRWQIDKANFQGNKKRHIPSVNHPAVNDTKAEAEKKGKKKMWQFGPPSNGTALNPTPYVGNAQFHTDKRARMNDHRSDGETRGKENQWIIDKDHPTGGGKDHDSNRSKNDAKSKLEGQGKANTWLLDKQHPTGGGKDHPENRSKNDPKSKREGDGKKKMWQFGPPSNGSALDPTPYVGNSQFHTDERARMNDHRSDGETRGKANEWIWDGKAKGSGKVHETNRSTNDPKSKLEAEGKANEWVYDGSVDGGGTSHKQNRNTNKKPTPVKWPPTRRALKAQALSDM
ncbi:MAG: hypothetical protein K6E34_03115 [Lachnospiraceae bacterium]|nr:hypothetical protein [Lachnospiraceae bacterium]